ncbi:MAG: HEAT repeat domain-containing protein [Elusimicrobia bacterium]|nr:HEAT repeat domain-containing protein [Elusimicrobiota bacterium]
MNWILSSLLASILTLNFLSAQTVAQAPPLDVKELAEQIKDKSLNPDIHIEAIRRLATPKYKNDIDVLEALMLASGSDSLGVRFEAVEAIGEVLADAGNVWLGVVGAVARRLDASEEEDPDLRAVAAQVLRKIKCTSSMYVLFYLGKAIDPELEMVDYVRQEAIMTLVSFGTPEALEVLQNALKRNEEVHRRRIKEIQEGISELEKKIQDKIQSGGGDPLF